MQTPLSLPGVISQLVSSGTLRRIPSPCPVRGQSRIYHRFTQIRVLLGIALEDPARKLLPLQVLFD